MEDYAVVAERSVSSAWLSLDERSNGETSHRSEPQIEGFAARDGQSDEVATQRSALHGWDAVKKAVFDRVVGAALLVLAAPLMCVIALSIKVSMRGPVLFRQTREGLNGDSFVIFKFRSMVRDDTTDQLRQVTRGDPRVTRLGSWLRRTSLDELPQLLNVLRGDMSLVGPRPHVASTRVGNRLFREVVPNYAARHQVKPGLTGWAQVNGLRGETLTEQQIIVRVAHDMYYIANRSLRLDLYILLSTLIQTLQGAANNAY